MASHNSVSANGFAADLPAEIREQARAAAARAVVVIPTYNEKQNLERIVAAIRRVLPEIHMLIVDDNSPDGTGVLADELSRQCPDQIQVLHRPGKEGLGRAYVAGFRRALEIGYDFVLQMDADLSHDPAYLPALLAAALSHDLVLGSRYLHGIAVVNWDFKRLLLSKCATQYVKIITSMPFSDATGGFKCWRKEALAGIGLQRVFSNGYLFQIEMTYRAWRAELRIGEVPIIFYERNLGRSKMDFRIVREAVWGVLKLRWKV